MAALAVIMQQRAKGFEKYGTHIEGARLPLAMWLRHAQEEVADASQYLAALDIVLGGMIQKLMRLRDLLEREDQKVLLDNIIVNMLVVPGKAQPPEGTEVQRFGDGTMNIRVNGGIERRATQDGLPILRPDERLHQYSPDHMEITHEHIG